jgi:hypothetical protein
MVKFDPKVPLPKGKYLVRTVSLVLKTVHYFGANVTTHTNAKTGKEESSVDVHNQTITHISASPLG